LVGLYRENIASNIYLLKTTLTTGKRFVFRSENTSEGSSVSIFAWWTKGSGDYEFALRIKHFPAGSINIGVRESPTHRLDLYMAAPHNPAKLGIGIPSIVFARVRW